MRFEAPYDGAIQIRFEGLTPAGRSASPVRLSHYVGDKLQSSAQKPSWEAEMLNSK